MIEVLDGGMGEELIRRGLPYDQEVWSARALLDSKFHSMVVEVHEDFIRAGAGTITTSNYSVTPGCGLGDRIEELCSLAGRLAQKAVLQTGQEVRVCGCLPPLIESYRPDLVLPFEEGVSHYQRVVESLFPYVDLFLAETMSSIDEAKTALSAAGGKGKPIWVSWTVRPNGLLRSGESPQAAVDSVTEVEELDGVLFNCATPESITEALKQIQACPVPIGVYANRLVEVPEDFKMGQTGDPTPFRKDWSKETYLGFAREWTKLGVTRIGGCCGVGVEEIAALKRISETTLGA